jgi:hypothetical protein
MFMTSTNEMGISGSREYGGEVYPATFEPACDAYAHAEGGLTTYKTRAGSAFLETSWQHIAEATPAASLLKFIKHTTNQPLFGTNGMCNHQTRIFDTPLSTGEHAPRPVTGAVRAKIPSVSESEMLWTEAAGVQVNSAFIEKHMIPCEEMRGWMYNIDAVTDQTQGVSGGDFEL